MKQIRFSDHVLDRMLKRGATREEIERAIREGKKSPAKKGRFQYEFSDSFNDYWGGKKYAMKKIVAVVAEEPDFLEVVTVYTYYYWEET